MKITSCSITIEVSKNENGHSENYYVTIDEQGANISTPYIKQPNKQVQLVHNIINEFIDKFDDINRKVDNFNYEMDLEEYTPGKDAESNDEI